MMIARFTRTALSVSLAALMLSACSLMGERYDMDSAEGIAKVKELIKANVDTEKYKIFKISWEENQREQKLENILSNVSAAYLDSNDDRYWININLINGKFVPDDEPTKGGGLGYSYELTTPIDIDAIDAAYIQKLTSEARELFNAEEDGPDYEYQSIESFSVSVAPVPLRYVSKLKESGRIDAEYTQPKYMFELNYTKKGEKSEYTGRHIVTNYYGVKFETDEGGKVVFDN